MAIIVGDGTTGFEAFGDRIQLPYGTNFPSNPTAGQLFFKSDEDKVYIRNAAGSAWEQVSGSSGSGNLSTLFDILADNSAIALYALDGNAANSSGNAATNGTASNLSFTGGKFGTGSGNFNGTNSTISTPNLKNSYPISISMWVQSDLTVPFDPGSNGMDELFNMSINGQRVSCGFVRNSGWPTGITLMYGGTSHFSGHTAFLSDTTSSTWHHIVYSIAGSANTNHRVWIDASPVHLVNVGGAHGGSAGWNIGSNSTSGEFWDGRIDQVRVFNKTLTDDEVWYLYREGAATNDIVTSGLKLWYDFSNLGCYSGSGTTVNNLAPNHSSIFTGTLVNNPPLAGSGQAKYIDFERDNSTYISTSTNPSSVMANKQVTLEVWAYHESIGSDIGSMISSQSDSSGQNGVSISTDGRTAHGGGPNGYHYQLGRVNGGYTTDGGSGNTAANTGNVSNRWDHIVATFDGSKKLVYENGSLLTDMGSFEFNGSEGIEYSNIVFLIGAQPEGGTSGTRNRFYDGGIAIARIYDVALSPAQIAHHYNTERGRFGAPAIGV